MTLDSAGQYAYWFLGVTTAVLGWWTVRAREYLRLHPNAHMPRWLRSLVGTDIEKGYPLLAKVFWFAAIILGASTAYAGRLSPLDGAIKVCGILVWWLFGARYVERLLSPGDDSSDKRHD